MSDKIRDAFDAWIASIDKRRDANGWEPLTARDVNMLREGYMEAALAQQPAPVVPDGWKLVPVERIQIAIEAVQNAMLDAYSNAYQECCGRWQCQCCGDPDAAWSAEDQRIMDALSPAQRELSALLAAAPAAPVAQEPVAWISVADRLPGEDSEVIVSGFAYNDPARGRFVTHAEFSDGLFKPVGAADEYDTLHPPTHWMPMPAAPGDTAPPAAEQPDDYRWRAKSGLRYRDWQYGPMAKTAEGREGNPDIEIQALYLHSAAEQPDTVKVPRLLLMEALEVADDIGHDGLRIELRALLSGGEK